MYLHLFIADFPEQDDPASSRNESCASPHLHKVLRRRQEGHVHVRRRLGLGWDVGPTEARRDT